jgi:Zn-dependent M28 family amino/carboxypeptidase
MCKFKQLKNNLPILFLIICFCAAAAFAQTAAVKISTEDEIKEDLKLVPCKNGERLEAAKKLFQKLGAADEQIKIETYKDLKNLVVTKKGKTDEIIIVGAHYDKVSEGCGAIDNWTGIVIVANLYRTIKDLNTEKTYVFVAFDSEELGLLGSAAMAKAIPKEKRVSYCSMVNFDSFGFTYPQVLNNASSAKMTKAAKDLAGEMKIPFANASLAGAADADSTSFVKKDIPAITLHGLSNNWQDYLHGSKDQLENVNAQSVHIGYRYALNFLAKADAVSCEFFRK